MLCLDITFLRLTQLNQTLLGHASLYSTELSLDVTLLSFAMLRFTIPNLSRLRLTQSGFILIL